MSRYLIIGSLLFFCGCNLSLNPSGKKPSYYFDLQGFMQEKIKLLNKAQPAIVKTTWMNGQQEKKQLQKINWEKELELFLESDINKLSFRGLYDSTQTSTQETSTLTYTSLNQELPVEVLEIKFAKPTHQVIGIYARLTSKNYLYSTQKSLHISFKKDSTQTVLLEEYTYEGKQKMIFSSEENFRIHAKAL